MNLLKPTDEDATLIRAFLEAQGDFVSGSMLAERLGISRVSVRSRIQKLEETGFAFEAVRNRGYRLIKEPDHLHPCMLDACLTQSKVTAPVHAYETLDSTNSEAERLLSAGEDAPFVVFATRQEAGRGRMGRRWHSDSKENLYLSLAFRPQLPPARMTKFTLWMGASLCDLLDRCYSVPAQVKWPNDILCNGRKLAGMLTEARIDTDHTRDLIFGLGLNVNSEPETMPEDVRDIAASVRSVTGKTPSINRFAADVIAGLVNAYDLFVSGAYEALFRQRWIDHDCLNGKTVSVQGHAGELRGIVAGLNDDGSLSVVREDGSRVAVRAGDVSITTQGIS